jgi:hypothetical protein
MVIGFRIRYGERDPKDLSVCGALIFNVKRSSRCPPATCVWQTVIFVEFYGGGSRPTLSNELPDLRLS